MTYNMIYRVLMCEVDSKYADMILQALDWDIIRLSLVSVHDLLICSVKNIICVDLYYVYRLLEYILEFSLNFPLLLQMCLLFCQKSFRFSIFPGFKSFPVINWMKWKGFSFCWKLSICQRLSMAHIFNIALMNWGLYKTLTQ